VVGASARLSPPAAPGYGEKYGPARILLTAQATTGERNSAFNREIHLASPADTRSGPGLLDHLRTLTFDFEREGRKISAVAVYAEPGQGTPAVYRTVAADDTGYEGIACLDDTARAATLALALYEQSRSRTALLTAQRWLTFVEYMQYPDGTFANFIRNAAGIRNSSGPTSRRGGYWWSVRALRALARAYRLTRRKEYLDRYRACRLDPLPDGKINGMLALAELELHAIDPSPDTRSALTEYCEQIVEVSGDAPYLLDHPQRERIHFWGYHQFEALALAAPILERPDLLERCARTVRTLIAPAVRARMWRSYPDRLKAGLTAYDVSPIVTGLTALHVATNRQEYRTLALQAAAWFYGRNDARTAMYDPTTGRCRDGITDGRASMNYGAESSIEAGFAELARRSIIAT
jgi:hypothetical protein